MIALFFFRCCSCQNPVISVNLKHTREERARKKRERVRERERSKQKLNSKTQNFSLSRARVHAWKKITRKRRTKLSPHPPCSIDRCVRESPNRTIFSRRDVNPISVLNIYKKLFFSFFFFEDFLYFERGGANKLCSGLSCGCVESSSPKKNEKTNIINKSFEWRNLF